ncbi:MAG: polysaccharide biosynthesis C-terminal domain-containing protein, partial [Planctomycetota bacterium]
EEWSGRTGAAVSALAIPNVYGDGGLPHYNSVVATFCYELAHGGKCEIHVDKELSLIYINELTEVMWQKIQNPPSGYENVGVKETATIKVSEILALLEKFREYYFEKRIVPTFENDFERNLYNVFITYMQDEDHEQRHVIHADDRGMLYEIVKVEDGGQVFYSTTKPGIVRGNHYHTRKMERFCVVKGDAVIRLRRIGTDEVVEYRVSGHEPGFIEIPIFHTHNIENVGQDDLHTLFWTNELYDPADPDTFYEEV